MASSIGELHVEADIVISMGVAEPRFTILELDSEARSVRRAGRHVPSVMPREQEGV